MGDLYVFYQAILYIGCISNIILAGFLVCKAANKKFSTHRNYQHTVFVAAIGYVVFGIGFLLHALYQPRIAYPQIATAVSMTYSHIGGVLFGYCYLSLVSERLRSKKFIAISLFALILSLIAYWYPFTHTLKPSPRWQLAYLAFFIQTIAMIILFVIEYFKLRKKEDKESIKLMELIDSLLVSLYIVATCGIVCSFTYFIFPDSLFLLGTVMILAYYAFYIIYRIIINAGHNLIDSTRSERDMKSRVRQMLFRYNLITHTIILVVALSLFQLFNGDTVGNETQDSRKLLNLTHNPMWDKPALGDTQYASLVNIISNTSDSVYLNEALKLDSMFVDNKEALRVSEIINNMPESQYKGVMQMTCLNNTLLSFPDKEITPELIHEYIEKGYKVVAGNNPVPKSIFFVFWNNCVLDYSNIHQTDSVTKEAMRLMRICRQEREPLGVMYAYMAMGYCLMEAYDYQGASTNFDKAVELAEQNFTNYLGKDWKAMDIETSDFLSGFMQTLSLNARCHVEANDTAWMRSHEETLLDVIKKVKEPTLTADIYYALSIYYDKWGQPEKYLDIMKRFKHMLVSAGYLNDANETANDEIYTALYHTILERHALRNNLGLEALNIIEQNPSVFKDSTKTYYPDALLKVGRYQEAAKRYKVTIDYYYNLLNGRNRHLIKTMSSNIMTEEKQMQLMQAELDSQHERMKYNALLTVILILTISGLIYFLYRQRLMNRKLNESLEMQEKLNHAKDIFLGNMRHELITPVNAIYGFAQVMADKDVPLEEDSTRMMAEEIVGSSEHLVTLMDNIVEATDKLSKLDHLEDVESIIKSDDSFKQKEL